MRRRRPTAGLTEELVLARLASADDEFATRAIRRHRSWRRAVDDGVGAHGQRALRRAWERARDDALIALGAREILQPRDAEAPRKCPPIA